MQVGTEPFEVEKNRALSLEMASSAFDLGADIVVMPEMMIHGYTASVHRLAQVAEEIPGPTTEAWKALAVERNGCVCAGICERDGASLYNSAVVVSPDGILLHYRKLHLFSEEKLAFKAGDLGLPVASTPFGTLGLCVCYDLRFVEVVRALSLKGAALICVPTAWLQGFDKERWDEKGMCPQAYGALFQSNLSQTFIACASQVGTYGEREFLGSSIVADPYGKVALGPLDGQRQVEVVEVDMRAVERAQVRDPLIAPRTDRRTDVYGISIDGKVL